MDCLPLSEERLRDRYVSFGRITQFSVFISWLLCDKLSLDVRYRLGGSGLDCSERVRSLTGTGYVKWVVANEIPLSSTEKEDQNMKRVVDSWFGPRRSTRDFEPEKLPRARTPSWDKRRRLRLRREREERRREEELPR
jgi:hypothetical protein